MNQSKIRIPLIVFFLIVGSCSEDNSQCSENVPSTFSTNFVLVSENDTNIFNDSVGTCHLDSLSFSKEDFIRVNARKEFLVHNYFPQDGIVETDIFHSKTKLGEVTVFSTDSNISCDWGKNGFFKNTVVLFNG